MDRLIGVVDYVKKTIGYKIVISIGVGALGVTLFVNYVLYRRKKILKKCSNLIDMIPELRQTHVRIKNPVHVERILSNIIHSGKERLQVIVDFDRTITKFEHNGQKCGTSCSVLENSRFVTPEFRQKFDNLRAIYLPIEHDNKLTQDEKIPFMVEWWHKSQNLTVATNIHRDNISEIVKNSNTFVRDGCNWFFYTLERYDIPVMIFSAGLGDVVQEFIRQQCGNFRNMKIVSNFMEFNNTTNRIVGFQGKLIHVFNKNEGVLLDTEYEKLVENRRNVILIGDSLGDAQMADGLPSISNKLKIGFLNKTINKNNDDDLTIYMDVFDIVIINDMTFNVPNAIIRSII